MGLSLKLGSSPTAAVSVLASFPIAWYIVYRARSNTLLYLIIASWITSYLVRIYGWRMILGSERFREHLAAPARPHRSAARVHPL